MKRHRSHTTRRDTARLIATFRVHSRSLAQATALIADGGTGVRDLVGVLRERCAVVSTLEQA